jgi:hypothetical protein
MTPVHLRPAPTVPRLATVSLLAAVVSHLHATVVALTTAQWVPAWHWAALALVESGLVIVALANPAAFTVRNFRLAGVFVTTISVIILAPLPAIVRTYHELAPRSMVLAIALGLALFGATLAIGLRLPERRHPAPHVVRSEPVVPLAIVGIAVLVFPIWIRSLGTIPILQLLRGTSGIEAALARDAALSKLPNAALRLVIGTLRNLYLMFAVGWMVAAAVSTPRKRYVERHQWAILAVFTVGIAAMYAIVTTERLVLGQMLLAAIVAGLVASGRRLTVRGVLFGLVAIGWFPVLFGLRAGVGGLGATFSGLKRRIFFVPGDVMMRYFVQFPRRTPFLEGGSIPKISRFTGGETFDLSVFIYREHFQRDPRLVGNANSSFLGVAWANFGMTGVIVWCGLIAVALVWVERLLRRVPTRSAAALRGVAVFQTAMLTSADLSRTLLGFAPGFLDLVLVLYVLRVVDERLAIRQPSSCEPAATQSRSRRGMSTSRRPTGALPARLMSPTAAET